MPSISLALPDLAPPTNPAAAPARAAALEALLARGDRLAGQAPDWRQWLFAAAGVATGSRVPLAALALGRRESVAFATPVHLVAGLDHLYLSPAGPPALEPDEQAELWAALGREFDAAGLPCGYLRVPALAGTATETHDPLPLAGREAGAWLPAGEGGPLLRRLMTELQMWLHGQALNRARTARGLAPVNALWLWGVGSLEEWPTGAPQAVLAPGDAALDGYWRAAGAPHCGASVADWLAAARGTAVVASRPLAGLERDAGTALARLEDEILAPLAAAVARGECDELRLHVAGGAWRYVARHRLRLWRGPRPWWEALA